VLFVFSLGVAVRQSTGTVGSAVQAVVAPSDVATDSDAAADAAQIAAALEARERVRASRGRAPATATPSPGPSAPAEPTPAAPAAAPEPVPVPLPVVVVVGQLWAATEVNVRSGPSTDNEPIGHLAAVTQVDVTGATDNGWTQVMTDGQTGWVKSSYLSESKPEPPPDPAAASPGVSGASCSLNPDIEPNLTGNARAVYRAVCAAFSGSVSSFGGYRPGDGGDHGSGRAVDIMVSGGPGWEIARYVQAHAAELGVAYVIYEQQIWQAGNPTSAWEYMADRGGSTANHYDHVHVSVS